MWMSQPELCKKYHYSRTTVYKYIGEMKNSGQYAGSIIGEGKSMRIREDAFQRHLTERTRYRRMA